MSDLAGPNQYHDSTAIERLRLAGAVVSCGAGYAALYGVMLGTGAVLYAADLSIRVLDSFRSDQIPQ